MKTANILGVNVSLLALEDALHLIRSTILSDQRMLITHVHVRGLNLAYEQEWFRQILNRSDLVYCDGMGVKLGARILGYQVPQRFTLADWIWPLAEMSARENFSLYFLGNPPGVADKAAARLQKHYPNLVIKGVHHGFFDKTPGHPENDQVIAQVFQAQPQILIVGFGMPEQEKWLARHWGELDVNVAITAGAVFEYISGEIRRAPRWMRENYLEWLYRLVDAPGRYGRRYLRDNPLFLYRLLAQKFFGVRAASLARRE
jgi:N-acetylglucosaminyldiphosphoundecaprenol N-acetyl-beta-D-mannosaminyltransferase